MQSNAMSESAMRMQDGLGALSSGTRNARAPDRIKENLPLVEHEPMYSREQYYRIEALKMAQSLPGIAELDDAILDLARHIAKQIREGF